MTTKETLAALNEIVEQSRHYFAAFSNESTLAMRRANSPQCHPIDRRRLVDDARRFASLAHEHANVLKIAGIHIVCNCSYCQAVGELINESPERQRAETIKQLEASIEKVHGKKRA